MVSILINSIPVHECHGQQFDQGILNNIFEYYCKIKRKENESVRLFREITRGGRMSAQEERDLSRLIDINVLIRHYNAYIQLQMILKTFALPGNCPTCTNEMKTSLGFIVTNTRQTSLRFRRRISALITLKQEFYT